MAMAGSLYSSQKCRPTEGFRSTLCIQGSIRGWGSCTA